LVAMRKPTLASELPYSEEPKDNPLMAPVTASDRFSRIGFRIGLFGSKCKRNQFPFFYQVEFGSYPNYPVGKGYFWRGAIGFKLYDRSRSYPPSNVEN
jgi:hypothetical protein